MKTSDFLSGILASWRRGVLFAPEGEGNGGGGTGDGGESGSADQDGAADTGEGDGVKPPAKGDEGNGAGDEANKGGGEAATVPETYDFSDTAIADLSDAHREAYQTVYKELGLSQDQVSSLLEAEKLIAAELGQSTDKEQGALSEGWLKASKEDAELSKDWSLTEKRAGFAIRALAGEDESVLTILDQSGLGNHPVILKAFARLGQYMSNDKFDKGDASENTIPTESSWYGDTTPATKRG